MDRVRLTAMTLICLSPGVFGSVAAVAQVPTSPKRMVEQVGIDQKLDAQVPLDLTFRDETGRTVRLAEYFTDRPVILTLVYHRCPMLCNQVLNGVLEASQAIPLQLARDYHIVSVSIDPNDTPKSAARKKDRYAKNYHRPGGEEGWHFLTGDEQTTKALASAVGFRFQYDPLSDQYAHASGIVVLTPKGRISRYFYGIDYEPPQLRLALVDSSENRIGTAVDQFLLLCYHYDPATGRYGLLIGRVLQLSGTATILCLGSFLWVMFRKERRVSAEPLPAPGTGETDSHDRGDAEAGP